MLHGARACSRYASSTALWVPEGMGKKRKDYQRDYTHPQLRERLKEDLKASEKGGAPGGQDGALASGGGWR